MADYKKMYHKLAVAMANSIEDMQTAMQEAEEIYLTEEPPLKLPPLKKDSDNG